MNELFLAQYNQMWEWKRFLIQQMWQVLTVLCVALGTAVSTGKFTSMARGTHVWPVIIIGFYVLGTGGLFLRYNAYQHMVGKVISYLESRPGEVQQLPTGGDDFERFFKGKNAEINSCYLCLAKSKMAFISWFFILVGFVGYLFLKCMA